MSSEIITPSFNPKYHLMKKDNASLGWLSSFKFFTVKGNKNGNLSFSTTPYPVIINNPTLGDVSRNINKSDLLFVGSSTVLINLYLYWNFLNLRKLEYKLETHRRFTMFHATFCLSFLLLSSWGRLVGQIDNGLRFTHQDAATKLYDFTSDYEQNSKWKYFSDRD